MEWKEQVIQKIDRVETECEEIRFLNATQFVQVHPREYVIGKCFKR